jgi:NAD+ dependent glucose-6-phosphate dehydrogenase
MDKQLKVLITGAAGNIGTKIRQSLTGRCELRLLDRDARGDAEILEVDLSKWSDKLTDAFQDIDVVVHLAANPDDTESWSNLIDPNLDATINTFIAASQNDVARLIFASSNHVMGGYKKWGQMIRLTSKVPPIPGTQYSLDDEEVDSTPYAATKLFGERLGKCFAESSDMQVIAVRIGWVQEGENKPDMMPEEFDKWFKAMWISNSDLCQLIEKCITVELRDQFTIINGMSNNSPMIWDLEEAKKAVGYAPEEGIAVS